MSLERRDIKGQNVPLEEYKRQYEEFCKLYGRDNNFKHLFLPHPIDIIKSQERLKKIENSREEIEDTKEDV